MSTDRLSHRAIDSETIRYSCTKDVSARTWPITNLWSTNLFIVTQHAEKLIHARAYHIARFSSGNDVKSNEKWFHNASSDAWPKWIRFDSDQNSVCLSARWGSMGPRSHRTNIGWRNVCFILFRNISAFQLVGDCPLSLSPAAVRLLNWTIKIMRLDCLEIFPVPIEFVRVFVIFGWVCFVRLVFWVSTVEKKRVRKRTWARVSLSQSRRNHRFRPCWRLIIAIKLKWARIEDNQMKSISMTFACNLRFSADEWKTLFVLPVDNWFYFHLSKEIIGYFLLRALLMREPPQ